MKKILVTYIRCLFVIGLFITFYGCKDKSNKQKDAKTTNQLDVIKNTTSTINTTINLMETTPITFEALERWFPKTLLDMQLDSVEKGSLSANDITSMVGHYRGVNDESFDLLINDAAGKNGSIVIGSFSIYKNMKVDKEDDYKLEKSFKNGELGGIETYHKRAKECMISSMYADRFAIVISSKKLERETVWDAIEKLPLDKLTN